MGINQSDCPLVPHVISPPSNLRMQNKALFTALCVALFAAAIAVPVNVDLQSAAAKKIESMQPKEHGPPSKNLDCSTAHPENCGGGPFESIQLKEHGSSGKHNACTEHPENCGGGPFESMQLKEHGSSGKHNVDCSTAHPENCGGGPF